MKRWDAKHATGKNVPPPPPWIPTLVACGCITGWCGLFYFPPSMNEFDCGNKRAQIQQSPLFVVCVSKLSDNVDSDSDYWKTEIKQLVLGCAWQMLTQVWKQRIFNKSRKYIRNWVPSLFSQPSWLIWLIWFLELNCTYWALQLSLFFFLSLFLYFFSSLKLGSLIELMCEKKCEKRETNGWE